jgi:hypothetical protein
LWEKYGHMFDGLKILFMKFFKTFSLVILSTASIFGQNLSNYVPFTGWGVSKNNSEELIILRKFFKDGHYCYFTLSPKSLNTKILSADSISINQVSWQTIQSRYSLTPYIHALKLAELYSDTLQDAGFTRFMPSQKGIDLTIDLCPSQRPLDRIVFTDLINEIGKIEKPVPIAVSITGRWISEHPGDLSWLDSLARTGELSILWINHSYNHHTYKNVPLKRNFMMAPGTDIDSEVLLTEIALLQKNIVPSVFFRFPGLVSDHDIYDKILNLGLIPVGSDAWLAKGQWPTDGSIVLIHANGNESVGVRDFINLLKDKRAEVLSKRWELYDLRESLIDDLSK